MPTWKKYKLKEVCTKIGSGATPSGGDASYKTQGISLIRSQNVLDFEFSKSGLAFIDEAQAKELRNVEVKQGDVLLNITGDSVARVCQVPSEVLPARVNQHVLILRADKEKFDSYFLKYALLSRQNKEMLLSLASTGATRKALTKVMLENFEIEAPTDLPTQTRIASILSSLDDKIELNRQMNQTLEQMAQALFKKYFVDDIDPENLPEGWARGVLGELMELQRGFDLPNDLRDYGQIPVYSASGINGFHSTAMVKAPGVTTGRSGIIGNVFYILDDFWPLNTSLFVKTFHKASPLYAYYVLKSVDLKGLNTGSAVPTLNRNHVHALPCNIPNSELIERFEKEVVAFFKLIKCNDEQTKKLTQTRDTLLPKLMSGEIDVNTKVDDEILS